MKRLIVYSNASDYATRFAQISLNWDQRRRRSLTRAQGWSAATTLGLHQEDNITLKGLDGWRTLSGLSDYLCLLPRVVAALQPWARISERLRRINERLRRYFRFLLPRGRPRVSPAHGKQGRPRSGRSSCWPLWPRTSPCRHTR